MFLSLISMICSATALPMTSPSSVNVTGIETFISLAPPSVLAGEVVGVRVEDGILIAAMDAVAAAVETPAFACTTAACFTW